MTPTTQEVGLTDLSPLLKIVNTVINTDQTEVSGGKVVTASGYRSPLRMLEDQITQIGEKPTCLI